MTEGFSKKQTRRKAGTQSHESKALSAMIVRLPISEVYCLGTIGLFNVLEQPQRRLFFCVAAKLNHIVSCKIKG